MKPHHQVAGLLLVLLQGLARRAHGGTSLAGSARDRGSHAVMGARQSYVMTDFISGGCRPLSCFPVANILVGASACSRRCRCCCCCLAAVVCCTPCSRLARGQGAAAGLQPWCHPVNSQAPRPPQRQGGEARQQLLELRLHAAAAQGDVLVCRLPRGGWQARGAWASGRRRCCRPSGWVPSEGSHFKSWA